MSQIKANPLGPYIIMYCMGHVHVNGGHHMGGPFHHRHPDALFSQVLSHLKANESGSDHSAG